MPALAVTDLHKSYGSAEALRGVSFEIEAGEFFGLLGPNGAGKTTTVEILEGYRRRDGGDVSVLGVDPERAGSEWRERIGVVLQSSAMYENLTVREHVALFAGYFQAPRSVEEVVELVGLREKGDARVKTLSGGQRRRLDLALGLIGDPEILFLDEPTTGFDPAARRAAWSIIRSLRELGKTVLLTTHYLDEAEQLSDRVAVLREGSIVALGKPAELTGRNVATEIRYRRDGHELVVETREPTRVLHELTGQALADGVELEGLQVRRPTLEEIYLELTGGLGYGVASTAFAGLAIVLVIRRESGILKRLRGTPLPAHSYVAAFLASTIIVFAIEALALILLARMLFDVPFPDHWLSAALSLLLGALAFAAMGVAVATLIRSAEGSSAVVNAIYLPMAFLAGSFWSPHAYPRVLEVVAELLPLTYFIRLMKDVLLRHEQIWGDWTDVAVIAAWGLAGLVVAVRRFRWEPQQG